MSGHSGPRLAKSRQNNIFKFESKTHNHTLIENLAQLREDCRFCDVSLIAKGVRVSAHRVVLAACSDYFKAMFTSEMLESRQQEIEMVDVEGIAIDALIDFFYCGKIKISDVNVPGLLHAASLLLLEEVKGACCEFLKKQFHPSNCVGIRALADNHSCQELLRCADEYILKNFQDIMGTEEFHSIPVSQLIQLISSEELVVRSEEQLLEHVRLPIRRVEFLVNIVSKNAVIMADTACRDLVDDAKNDLLLQMTTQERPKVQRVRRRGANVEVIYVVAGTDTRSVECLDPDGACPSWQFVAHLNEVRYNTGVAVVNEYIFAVCGYDEKNSLQSTERYDPASDMWISDVARCPTARHSLGVAALDCDIYAVGGSIDLRSLNVVERYDVRQNKWTSVPPMRSRRSELSLSELNGCLYAVGGYNDTVLNTVERFDPRVGRWDNVCPMSTPRYSHGSAALHGQLYVMGGRNGESRNLRSVEKYDPRSNKWTSATDMSSGQESLELAAVNGKLYAIGGLFVNSVEVFDPNTNQWDHHSNLKCKPTRKFWSGCCQKVVEIGLQPTRSEGSSVSFLSSFSLQLGYGYRSPDCQATLVWRTFLMCFYLL